MPTWLDRTVSVERLTEEINQAHTRCNQRKVMALHDARLCGELLSKVREQLGHGHFGQYVDEHFPFGRRQARRYLRLYRNWDRLDVSINQPETIDEALALLVDPVDQEAKRTSKSVLDVEPEELADAPDPQIGTPSADLNVTTEDSATDLDEPAAIAGEYEHVEDDGDDETIVEDDEPQPVRPKPSVAIDSGEFPLLRNIDRSRQPERSRVMTEWSKAFHSTVPWALGSLAELIEDVHSFEAWKEYASAKTPEQFFERIGLLNLDLETPAKLIRFIRTGSEDSEAEVLRDQLSDLADQQQPMQDEIDLLRKLTESNDPLADAVAENVALRKQVHGLVSHGKGQFNEIENRKKHIEGLYKQIKAVEGKLKRANDEIARLKGGA